MPNWDYERSAWEAGHTVVAGVDEAGRGPLAGPVVAAAVVLPPELAVGKLTDSMLLTPESCRSKSLSASKRTTLGPPANAP